MSHMNDASVLERSMTSSAPGLSTSDPDVNDLAGGSMLLDNSNEREPLIGKPKKKAPGCIPARHQLALNAFVAMIISVSMRQSVNVAMVAMANTTVVSGGPRINGSLGDVEICPSGVMYGNSTETNEGHGDFNWDSHQQELILAAFYYGFMSTQILGGWLSDTFGMKWVVGLGILTSSILSLLAPLAARTGYAWYFMTRMISGCAEGMAFPSMLTMWSKWAHPNERSSLSVMGYAGYDLGLVIGNALSGYLIELNILGGWPFTFYIYGSLGCLWFVWWSFTAYSTPAQHPWITTEEQEYIEEGLGHNSKLPNLKRSTPWRRILTSRVTWMLIVVHFGYMMASVTLFVNLPLYFSNGLRLPIEIAGLYSSIPFIAETFFLVFFGLFADWLFKSNILTKTRSRKLMSGIGLGSGGLFLMLTGFARCDVTQAVIYSSLSIGIIGAALSGHLVAILDVAGPFAGSAMGVINTCGNLAGIVGPAIVGLLTEVQSDITGWQSVMWVLAGCCAFSALVFVIFGTTDLQPWATTASEDLDDQDDPKDINVK